MYNYISNTKMSNDQQTLAELQKQLQKEIDISISLKRQIEQALKEEAALDEEIAAIRKKSSQVRAQNQRLEDEINRIKKELFEPAG